MVAVAEQFGNLRNTLGQTLGVFALIRWFRTLIAKITGRPLPADATSLTPSAFSAFLRGRSAPTSLPDGTPKPSKKPFIMFLLAVFGLPYLMGKLIRALSQSQEEEARRQQQMLAAPNGDPLVAGKSTPLDPSKLDFCRVLYDYAPEVQNTAGIDLSAKKGDIVAVLSKSDPTGQPSEWWRCRARDGRVGYLPSPYLETIQRRPTQQAITAGSVSDSRASTMKSTSSRGDGNSVPATEKAKTEKNKPDTEDIKGKVGDMSPESFQNGTFYS
jgi:peroxin-13